MQNPISRCYPLVRDRLNESSTESRRDDESGHDDSARVLDEVAERLFTAPRKLMGTEQTISLSRRN